MKRSTDLGCVSRNTAILLVLSALWVCVCEVGVYYVYSSGWEWPQLRLPGADLDSKGFIRHDPPGVTHELLSAHHRHYQYGDIHYYTAGSVREISTEEAGVRILILSDPHIMCTFNRDEMWLARKDADHYLSTIFSHLMDSLHPDVVILLGDIFSDGFRASSNQWNDYLICLNKVFPLPATGVKLIAAFGDNDIGGEGKDIMNDEALRRYAEAFGPLNGAYSIAGTQFIKFTTVCYINEIPRTHAERACRKDFEFFLARNKEAFQKSKAPRLVLSHIPLHLTYNNRFHQLREMVLEAEPNYIFSGHVHHQGYSPHIIWEEGERGRSIRRLAHEITVPTCSYRMGEQFIGVGVAIIGPGGDMTYRVIWLPPRYPFLASYAVVFSLLLLRLCWTHKRNCPC